MTLATSRFSTRFAWRSVTSSVEESIRSVIAERTASTSAVASFRTYRAESRSGSFPSQNRLAEISRAAGDASPVFRQDLPALHEQLLGEGDPDALSRVGLRKGRLFPFLHRPDHGLLPRRGEDHPASGAEPAGLHAPRVDPLAVSHVDVLHREAERQPGVSRAGRRCRGRQGGSGPEYHAVRSEGGGDVVPFAGGDGDHVRGNDAHGEQESANVLFHLLEPVPAEADQVQLVDRHHHLPEPEEGEHVGVPAGLLPHALRPVDQQDRGVGRGGAGDHVLQELLVPGRVDDDVGPLGGLEEGLGRVDGDVLLPLLLQRVHQVGELERPPCARQVASISRYRSSGREPVS